MTVNASTFSREWIAGQAPCAASFDNQRIVWGDTFEAIKIWRSLSLARSLGLLRSILSLIHVGKTLCEVTPMHWSTTIPSTWNACVESTASDLSILPVRMWKAACAAFCPYSTQSGCRSNWGLTHVGSSRPCPGPRCRVHSRSTVMPLRL